MITTRRGFTLIELLIVVAIIAILAAIAVPNFLEAQTRAKVSRAQSDMRTLVTGIESYRVDHNHYPEGTDNPARYPQEIADFFGPLAPGYYTFTTRLTDGRTAGVGFATLTTPVAYLTSVLYDPFASQHGAPITYCYRNAKDKKNGFIVTSFGPDSDALAPNGSGTANTNPLSTAGENPGRLGDISERKVIHYFEKTNATIVNAVDQMGGLKIALQGLAYDPTNGTVSDGDLYRVGP